MMANILNIKKHQYDDVDMYESTPKQCLKLNSFKN